MRYFFSYTCDVSRKENVDELANKILSEVGDVNILINNAGVLYCRPFVQWTPNQIEQVVQTNLMGMNFFPKDLNSLSNLYYNWVTYIIFQILLLKFRPAVDVENVLTTND